MQNYVKAAKHLGLCLALSACANAWAADKQVKPKAAPAKVAAVEEKIPTSVFTIPATPAQGRNPFFPASGTSMATTQPAPSTGLDLSYLVLNGITSPPKRMAMINGRSFESGERGEVKLQDGSRLPIHCLEIRDETVLIAVAGQKRELRLRNGI